MHQSAQLIIETIQNVYPSGLYLPFTLCAIAWLIFRRRDRMKTMLAVYSVLVLAAFFMPPVAYVMTKVMGKDKIYWRVLWILPYLVLIPAVCTEISSLSSKRLLNAVTAAALIAALTLGGSTVYRGDVFRESVSRDKVEDVTLMVADAIAKNIEETGDDYVYLACNYTVTTQIRQVDARIKLYRGRTTDVELEKHAMVRRFLRTIYYQEKDKKNSVRRIARRHGINYIMIFSKCKCDKKLKRSGYTPICGRNGWNLWYKPAMKPRDATGTGTEDDA